jgi:hypothetical protein
MSGALILTRRSCSPRASWLHHTSPVQEKYISKVHRKKSKDDNYNPVIQRPTRRQKLPIYTTNYAAKTTEKEKTRDHKRQEDVKEA